eukprot:NODE_1601_length_928_cov_26.632537_g1120_i0.p1 GENE.NODE_1601_length_928_cov_26.632537_g1120_i0~~NODE_1601_length_928_cov_26.632537_g1120_i0.p1  ORF type:complete len:189 (-),score=34.44 NODE_1601_length_928_cov_26.632537_g1120_i0:250-816(-)
MFCCGSNPDVVTDAHGASAQPASNRQRKQEAQERAERFAQRQAMYKAEAKPGPNTHGRATGWAADDSANAPDSPTIADSRDAVAPVEYSEGELKPRMAFGEVSDGYSSGGMGGMSQPIRNRPMAKKHFVQPDSIDPITSLSKPKPEVGISSSLLPFPTRRHPSESAERENSGFVQGKHDRVEIPGMVD